MGWLCAFHSFAVNLSCFGLCLRAVFVGAAAEQGIRQTCLSSHLGVIGQRLPAPADESVRCITGISSPPGFRCKGLFSRVFCLPPPAICTAVPSTRPRVRDESQRPREATALSARKRPDSHLLRPAARPGSGPNPNRPIWSRAGLSSLRPPAALYPPKAEADNRSRVVPRCRRMAICFTESVVSLRRRCAMASLAGSCLRRDTQSVSCPRRRKLLHPRRPA